MVYTPTNPINPIIKIGSNLKESFNKTASAITGNSNYILLFYSIFLLVITLGAKYFFNSTNWGSILLLLLLFVTSFTLHFIFNMSVIYNFMFVLICISGILFLINKVIAIIVSIFVGLLLVYLLYATFVQQIDVGRAISNFFSDMSISDPMYAIKKILGYMCDSVIKGFIFQFVSKSMLFIFLIYLAFVVYIYTKEPYQTISDNKSIFLFIFLLIGFLLLSLLVMGFEAFIPFALSFFKYLIIFSFVIAFILGVLHVYKNVPLLANTILFIINITILIGIFALIVKYIGAEAPNYISGPPTWSSLLFKLLIYIPCLFLNVVDYFRNEFKLAQKQGTYVIILIIEVILIILLFLLPKIFDAVINHNGEVILEEVLPLEKETTLPDTEIADANNNITSSLTPSLSDNVQNNKPNYNYGISAWFYIHPQPPNTNASYTTPGGVNIINFSTGSTTGSPQISYDAKKNVLFIKVDNTSTASASASIIQIPPVPISTDYPQKRILMQRWNHLFINFYNGTMDVFLNSHLESSTPNIIPQLPLHVVTGTDKGIYGQVCNIVYYKNVLGENEISWIYNAYKNLNPPYKPKF